MRRDDFANAPDWPIRLRILRRLSQVAWVATFGFTVLKLVMTPFDFRNVLEFFVAVFK